MSTPLSRLNRGQTLVLFSLTMLFLVLLVAMTLSTGMKVKEKMEVQSVADAAAYSNAVATARTYNEIALMQRAQVGHLVAMAGVQSAISWTSYYRAEIAATSNAYKVATLPYIPLAACCIKGCPTCKCAIKAIKDLLKTSNKVSKFNKKLNSKWDSPDQKAGKQSLDLQGAAASMGDAQKSRYDDLEDLLKGQKLANDIVKKASQGSPWSGEWKAPAGADSVSLREFRYATNRRNKMNRHQVYAAMGSRGHTFTTTRGAGAGLLTVQINKDVPIPKPDRVILSDEGSAYWNSKGSPAHGKLPVSGGFAWADDHGGSTVLFRRNEAPCPPSVGYYSASARVKSTDIDDGTDKHDWSPRGSSKKDNAPARDRHRMGKCTPGGLGCPGMWPMFVDYNQEHIAEPTNMWAQPKNFAVIQRDYAARGSTPDPWSFDFSFAFTDSPVAFSNEGKKLSTGGTNISKQTALSAGITYYHRANEWDEPPNLLNPFWRATLVPATIDDGNGADVQKALKDANVPWAADAYKELKSKGFKGGP